MGLEQNNSFSGLQWELSVRNKFDLEAKQILEKKIVQEGKATTGPTIYNPAAVFFSPTLEDSLIDVNGGDSDEDSDLTTLKVTEKKVEKHQREMEVLFFSLASSRVFFRDS